MINVTVDIELDTVVSDRYVQTGEESFDAHPVTFADAIVTEAARQLLGKLTNEERVGLRKQVLSAVSAQIEAAVAPMLAVALDESFRPTNALGEPYGQPISLRQMVVDSAKKQLSLGTDGNAYRAEKTVLQKHIDSVTAKAISVELAAALDEAKSAVVEKLQSTVSATLADTIVRKLS